MATRELLGLDIATDPDAWRGLGFAVDDDDVCAIDGVAIQLGRPGRKICGWALADIPEGMKVDGLPRSRRPRRPSHPRTRTGRSRSTTSS